MVDTSGNVKSCKSLKVGCGIKLISTSSYFFKSQCIILLTCILWGCFPSQPDICIIFYPHSAFERRIFFISHKHVANLLWLWIITHFPMYIVRLNNWFQLTKTIEWNINNPLQSNNVHIAFQFNLCTNYWELNLCILFIPFERSRPHAQRAK